MLTIHVQSNHASAALKRLLEGCQRPRPIPQAAAIAVRRELQRHFRARDKAPNKLGGKRSHWWAGVARATNVASVSDNEAVISISEPGLGLKISGGTIRAKEAGALTIPIQPEAYGRRAKTVEMVTGRRLFRVEVGKLGVTFLARSTGDDTLRLLSVLKQTGRVPADPQAIPSRDTLESVAMTAAETQARSQFSQARLA